MTIDRIVVLSGGVGGAKLVRGMALAFDPKAITVIGNIGDDTEIHGLRISPDLDTLMYTLCGEADPERGWGMREETFACRDALKRLGAPSWFNLGDRDLATHIVRTTMMAEGQRLTGVTRYLLRKFGVQADLIPPSDDPVRTEIRTSQGWIGFQEYFVRERFVPAVVDIRFRGVETARASVDALEALDRADLIVIAPSNPVASIGPTLALGPIREKIRTARVPRIAVSPFIGGSSLKGPSDKMMSALGYNHDPIGLTRYYEELIDGVVIDNRDADLVVELEQAGFRVRVSKIHLTSDAEKSELARQVVRFAEELRRVPA